MKNNSLNKLLVVVFLLSIVVYIFLSNLDHIIKPVEPTFIRITGARLCANKNGGYSKVDYFKNNEQMFVCGSIEFPQNEIQKQIQLFIIQENHQYSSEYEYYDKLWVNPGDSAIPININLEPGVYRIIIYDMKVLLCDIQ